MPTSDSDEGEDRSIDKDGTQTPNTGALRRTSVGSSKSSNNMSGSRWEAMKKLQSSIKTPLVRATAHAGIASPGGLITPLVKSPSSSPSHSCKTTEGNGSVSTLTMWSRPKPQA